MVEITLANGDVKRFMHIYDGRISETFNNHLSNQGSTGKGGRDRREPPGLQSKIFEVDPATNRIIKDGINVAKHGKHSEVFLLNHMKDHVGDHKIKSVDLYTSQN